MDGDEPYVCEIEQDRPTYVGFVVRRRARSIFSLDFHCDYQVEDSGADKRHLSFVLSELRFGGDLQPPVLVESSDPPRFGPFAWTAEAVLQGHLIGGAPETLINVTVDDGESIEVRTDGIGRFALDLSKEAVGHSATTVRVVAGEVSTEFDIMLDPSAIGGERATLPLPVPPRQSGQLEVSAASPTGTGLNVHADVAGAMAPLVHAMTVQTEALRALLFRSDSAFTGLQLQPLAASPALDVASRYGPLFENAAGISGVGHDVIWLGVIDWDFRIQRPQHIATELARRGSRVFYISIVFGARDERGRFEFLKSPEHGVYEVRLKLGCALPSNIYARLETEVVREILSALDEMIAVLSIKAPIAVVQYPSWAPVAFGIPGAVVLHDCLDLVSGFENTPADIVKLEHELIDSSDIVVTASQPLSELIAKRRPNAVIRNGADIDFFAKAAKRPKNSPYKGKVIGYFGAIAHWFESDWIAEAAEAHPDWTFVLIGDAPGIHQRRFSDFRNIVLLGEKPYSELPEHLAYFDVAVIPFKLLDLILCTNPVKLYEYMAAGKPVVASAMPEVVAATDLVYVAEDSGDFVGKIEQALAEDCPKLRRARTAWVQQHGWNNRGKAFSELLGDASPKVSVIVLSYKNWEFTRATLSSILAFSDYQNMEIIVVDNGSGEEIQRNLKDFETRDPRIKLVLSDRNLGYAAGNNLGIREATGEYVILLNNDTYVTKGWVRDLIRPLRLDESIGLVSPLTNNIGNEQRVAIHYGNMEEMALAARLLVRQRSRERFETDCVAFFCVAVRRDVLEKVGLLDESYGLGFFEDDDYCKRVLKAGYRIQITDDVFVHHHLSASFDQLGQERKSRLMAENRAKFEARWGTWKPHSHRSARGFG